MLDLVFLDAIGALRDAFENALLERQALEERFQVDVLLGDTSWETAYSLPGEGLPPRVVAEVTLEWPTWSQAAYRSWSIGEATDDRPEIDIEIVLRLQRLAKAPEPTPFVDVLPDESPPVGEEALRRSTPTVEQQFGPDLDPVGGEVGGEGVGDEQAPALVGVGVGKLAALRRPLHAGPVVLDLDHDAVAVTPGPQLERPRRPAGETHGVGAQLRRGKDEVGGVLGIDRHVLEPVGEQVAGQRNGRRHRREAVFEGAPPVAGRRPARPTRRRGDSGRRGRWPPGRGSGPTAARRPEPRAAPSGTRRERAGAGRGSRPGRPWWRPRPFRQRRPRLRAGRRRGA